MNYILLVSIVLSITAMKKEDVYPIAVAFYQKHPEFHPIFKEHLAHKVEYAEVAMEESETTCKREHETLEQDIQARVKRQKIVIQR